MQNCFTGGLLYNSPAAERKPPIEWINIVWSIFVGRHSSAAETNKLQAHEMPGLTLGRMSVEGKVLEEIHRDVEHQCLCRIIPKGVGNIILRLVFNSMPNWPQLT